MDTAVATIVTAGTVTFLFTVMGGPAAAILELHVELGAVRLNFDDWHLRYCPGATQWRDGQGEGEE
jgi:hypothetical protein